MVSVSAGVWHALFYPLQKQMQYLESQQRENEAAKEEAKRLRVKMKTYERYVFGVSVYFCMSGLHPAASTHDYERSSGV